MTNKGTLIDKSGRERARYNIDYDWETLCLKYPKITDVFMESITVVVFILKC